MKYIKQFDGLRGIAVLFVVFYHWLHTDTMDKVIPNGFNVVDVFFVLSGFLITRILLESRNKAEAENIKKIKVYQFFFVNRALRIFPIYYLTIMVMAIVEGITRVKLFSLITYTYNFYAFFKQQWDDFFGHVWTLAVEEQFYIFWPWIVLLLPRKWLAHVFSAFIVIGVVTEFIVRKNTFGHVLPTSCFDSLGMGALLSWIYVYRHHLLKQTVLISGLMSLAITLVFIYEFYTQQWSFIPSRLTLSIDSFWLIAFILLRVQQNKVSPYFILNSSILIWVGKISYGIYLYHIMLPDYSWQIFLPLNKLLPAAINQTLILNIENFFFLIFFSWLSYRFIEKPILGIRKRLLPKNMAPSPMKTPAPVVT